jgi:hypothetical protein
LEVKANKLLIDVGGITGKLLTLLLSLLMLLLLLLLLLL